MYGSADLDQGSFASHAVWREAFLFKLPDELSDEDCAPMCVIHALLVSKCFYFIFILPPMYISMRRVANENTHTGCAAAPRSGTL